VAIAHPLNNRHLAATVWLNNRALGTSAGTHQWFDAGGRRYGHILDPRTGWPAEALAGVSVLAPTAAAEARIDQWHDEIVRHFQNQNNPLTDDQKARLALLRDRLKQQPPTEDLDWYFIHDEVLKVPADKAPPQFTSLEYLQASAGPFRGLFRGLAPDIDGLKRLSVSAAQARLDERCQQLLEHYRSRGYPFNEEQSKALAAARDRLSSRSPRCSLARTFRRASPITKPCSRACAVILPASPRPTPASASKRIASACPPSAASCSPSLTSPWPS
jgi:hypothetical protein